MLQKLLLLILFVPLSQALYSSDVKGKIYDAKSGEQLFGATIYLKEINLGTISGFDGSYLIKNIPDGNYTIFTSYLSYYAVEEKITIKNNQSIVRNFNLLAKSTELDQVTINGYSDKGTDVSARITERNAEKLTNIVSAKTIELSPDLDVANVIQRMSGVTLDKSSSGSGQYALLRGMDKRYNYTLVNGIKIPSTHNKHRYISLDMFPSDMVDRVEVSKALTPDMEGDAIAGVVNLIMKNAPDRFLFQVNASTGYSQFFLENDFLSFDKSVINPKSPYERNASGYRAVPSDFPTQNIVPQTVTIPVNFFGNLTLGNRFLDKKLGWIISASIQSQNTGTNSLVFRDDLTRDGKNLPVLTSMQERLYSDNKQNYGIHNKIDYRLDRNNRFNLYAGYVDMQNTQIRETQNTDLAVSYDPGKGDINRSYSTRFRYNNQSLLNTTLQGNHQINSIFSAQWSAVYSYAKSETPDEATISYGNSLGNFQLINQFVDFDGSDRIWRRNSDKDIAAYLNLVYKPTIFGISTEIKGGGLYRDKKRESFYNKYTLNAIVNVSNSDTSYTSFYSEKGVDWNNFDEILWRVYNPRGTVAVGENYGAYEKVMAGYLMLRTTIKKVSLIGGFRLENTEQGYSMTYPIGELEPNGNQKYSELLPSVNIKYSPIDKHNLRFSYYRAINKPGFQEIVPFVDNSEAPTAGNKDLKHAVGDNVDLRWEYFPAPLDQFMVGLFYKNIKNPIEFAFDKFRGNSRFIVFTPINSPETTNYGVEIDMIKYFREFGIKGNYTLTRSNITTNKLSRIKNSLGNDTTVYVPQSRPLFGQSAHVANISFLYKGSNNGLGAQLAFSYNGERIYAVSRYIDNDFWQKGYWQLDASAEKKFKNGLSIFVKAKNLLNTHLIVYIKNTNPMNDDVPFHDSNDETTLVRDEFSMPSYLIGIRYKL